MIVLLLISSFGIAQNPSLEYSSKDKNLKLRGIAELGFLAVLKHQIQFSNSGTYINYVQDGGQDVLFPVS